MPVVSTLFSYRWVGRMVHPKCKCGWEGTPRETLHLAKADHSEHVTQDCPIGKR